MRPPLHSCGDNLSWGSDWQFSLCELAAIAHVAQAGHFYQWLPNGIDQVMLDQQVPEAIRALVQVRHGDVERDGLPLLRPAAPDRGVGEETLVDPGVSVLEFLGRHVLRAKDGMARVVEAPVAMQNSSFAFHLPE